MDPTDKHKIWTDQGWHSVGKRNFLTDWHPFLLQRKESEKKNRYRPNRKDDILIIQSSSIGTSASRRYQSTQNSYIEHKEWDNATGTSITETTSEVTHIEIATNSRNGVLNDIPLNHADTSEHSTTDGDLPEENTKDNKSVAERELEDFYARFKPFENRIPTVQERLEMVRDMQRQSFDYLIHILFGEDAKNMKGLKSIDRITTAGEASANNPVTIEAMSLGQTLGTGGSHYSYYYCSEKETTCFETTGTAVTADGRKLSFNISLEMSRSFTKMAEENCIFGQPRLCDPLVINLNTNVASVSDQKFFFDIDADGTKDEISMLNKNSGYLALDNNGDGIINDGSELFGTTSGNGFKDLLAYDEDGNGWIDEADSIFQKLKVWVMNEDGRSELMDLKNSGVGAIYLGYEDTEFSLKNAENETNAVIRKTGLFLYENGMSGTVQQLDLAV